MGIKDNRATIHCNTVCHAGNYGAKSELDVHYVEVCTQSSSNTCNTLVRREIDILLKIPFSGRVQAGGCANIPPGFLPSRASRLASY